MLMKIIHQTLANISFIIITDHCWLRGPERILIIYSFWCLSVMKLVILCGFLGFLSIKVATFTSFLKVTYLHSIFWVSYCCVG